MRILAILSAYNEEKFLPLKIEWCKSNNIDLYVCDNMSTDNTIDILRKNHIRHHRYDTMGIFSEYLMRNEILMVVKKENPDWVIYMGCDLFPNIKNITIDDSYNCYSFQFISAKNTGEDILEPFNPFDNYRYGMIHGKLRFLFKWSEDVYILGDDVFIPNQKCFDSDTIIINYGDTKPSEQRNEYLQRRKKAWDNGENHMFGEHYRVGNSINWKWDRLGLVNFEESRYWQQIQQIKKDCGL